MSWPALRSTQPPVQCISGILYATVFHQKSGHQFREETVKCYIWSKALYVAETWILRNVYQKYFESFEMWWWTRKEKIIWMYRVQNAVLRRVKEEINPLNPELNPICYLLALLGAHHFLHVSRIRVKSLTFRRLMSYIYGAPILDVSRSHTTTQHSR